MNLIGVSNMFNVLALAHPEIEAYHFGWRSDIKRGVSNNHTPQGEKKYISVHLDFPTERTTLDDSPQTKAKTFLVLSAPQGRKAGLGNEGQNITLVEQFSQLKKVALELIASFEELGRIQYKNKVGLSSQDLGFSFMANAYNDKLVTCLVELEIFYKDDCPEIYTIDGLSAPFNEVPADQISDYEKHI